MSFQDGFLEKARTGPNWPEGPEGPFSVLVSLITGHSGQFDRHQKTKIIRRARRVFFEMRPGHTKLAGRASKAVYERYPDRKGPNWPEGPGLFQKNALKRQLRPKPPKKPIILGISKNLMFKDKISERGFREGITVQGQTIESGVIAKAILWH